MKNTLILGEFIEAETGKGTDALERRPQLAAALKAARKANPREPIELRYQHGAPKRLQFCT